MLAEGYLGGPSDLLGYRGHQGLHHGHDIVIVGIGLVALQQGELRFVVLVNALVAKHFPQLVDFIEAAYDEAFQVQFGSNSEVELLVQGIWWVTKGLAWAPAATGTNMGVSTSRNPLSSKNLRMALITPLR